jgi:uncharacterized phage infection (PIP) family protein YhgE
MSDRAQWIAEVAQEIKRSQASLKQAIKDTGKTVNSKYDVLLCYAEWSVPKLKDVEKKEAQYQKRIEHLTELIDDFRKVTQRLEVEFNAQMERKDQLIETQNQTIADREQTIAEQARIIAELEELLRSLPLASGES